MQIAPRPLLLSVRVFFYLESFVISENLCFKSIKLLTLFTFARIRSFQEICYRGKDLVECLARTVCIMKPVNDVTSNKYFTLENVRKCIGHMHLCLRDLLSAVYRPRNLPHQTWARATPFDKQLKG